MAKTKAEWSECTESGVNTSHFIFFLSLQAFTQFPCYVLILYSSNHENNLTILGLGLFPEIV